MLERDILNLVRSYEIEGEKIVEEAQKEIDVLKKHLKETENSKRVEAEYKLEAMIDEYRKLTRKELEKELDELRKKSDATIKEIEKTAVEKFDFLLKKSAKEVLDAYGN
ncbi:MAG: hypothetical protein KBI30_03465 [Candidatus Atribacteria bacterium]|nr:hypothetical protein [Candidatus Atribacteria bacterium]